MDLNILYQVREYAEVSGDKTTDNLDVILNDKKYQSEYENYINYITAIGSENCNLEAGVVISTVDEVFRNYVSNYLISIDKVRISFKKKIGSLILLLPVLGKKIVDLNREYERKKMLKSVLENSIENSELNRIEKIILEYEW